MYVRDSLEDKTMLLVHFKKAFPLTLFEHSFQRRAYWLLFHFESYQGIPYSYIGKRLLIFICQEKNRNLACISNKHVINC